MTEFKQNLKWILVFFVLISVSVLVILSHSFLSKPAKTADIIQNGKIIRTVNLENVAAPYEFKIISPDGGENTVRVEEGKIGIIHASCPDKLCVKQGFTDNGVLPIVCLPNKLSIVVKDNSDFDAATGGSLR